MDISRRVVNTYFNEDQRWLKGGIVLRPAQSVILERGPLVALFANGFIPSGIVLGRVTATGRYVRYTPGAVDGSQTAAGLLLTTVPYDRQSSGDLAGALVVECDVIVNYLPAGSNLDAAARTALAPLMRFHDYVVARP